jgi:GNAT superfamily N-acetyltransferase
MEKSKPTDLKCREATRSDAPTLVDYQIAMAQESEELELNREICSRGVEALFDNPLLGQYLVAESEGQLIGCLLVTYEWSDWRNGLIWWIQSVYVHPHFRGRKVFSALYRHLQQKAMADSHVRGLRLYVENENAKALAIYESLGMKSDRYKVCEWLKEPE